MNDKETVYPENHAEWMHEPRLPAGLSYYDVLSLSTLVTFAIVLEDEMVEALVARGFDRTEAEGKVRWTIRHAYDHSKDWLEFFDLPKYPPLPPKE